MKKTTKLCLLLFLTSSVSACDATQTPEEPKQKISQRDVYNSLEDCVADWGDTELCTQQMKEAREHAEKMAAAQGHSGGGTFIFWGPSYFGDSRSINHNGKTITPTTTNATRTANVWNGPNGARTISYAAPKAPVASGVVSSAPKVSAPALTSSVARGGFGATGAASSSSGS